MFEKQDLNELRNRAVSPANPHDNRTRPKKRKKVVSAQPVTLDNGITYVVVTFSDGDSTCWFAETEQDINRFVGLVGSVGDFDLD